MPNNEVVMGTVNTVANEAVKKADKTGILFVGLGFLGGVGLTVGAIEGVKAIKHKRSEKKAKKEKKAAETAVVTE